MKTPKDILRNVAGFLLLFSVVITAWQCFEMPASPMMPSADIKLAVPIADIQQTLLSATKNSAEIKHNSDSTLYITQAQSGKPADVAPITVTPEKSGTQVTIGRVQVDGVPSTSQTILVGDLGISTINYPGATPPFIPAFPASNVSAPPIAIDQSAQFDYVEIASGSMNLTITNNLPLRLTFAQPIVLRNNKLTAPVDTSVIASFNIGTLDSAGTVGSSKQIPVNLAGKFLRGILKTDSIKFQTQSRSDAFQIKSSHGISFSFGTSALQAEGASAVIPSQTVSAINDSVITIDSIVVLERASFRTGGFTLKVTNNLGVDVGVRLKFDNFVSTRTDSSFFIDDVMSGHTEKNISVAFDTIFIRNQAPDNRGTKMKFSVGIRTVTSNGAKSTITASDFVRAEFIPTQSFSIKSITGRAPNQTIPILYGAQGWTAGDIAKNFDMTNPQLDGINIEMKLGLTGGYPVEYDLTLIAKNRSKNIVDSLKLPIPANGTRRIFDPLQGTMTLAMGNTAGLSSFLSKFVPNLPDTFIVRGSVRIVTDTVLTLAKPTLYDTTKFYNSFNVYFPLNFGLGNGKIFETLPLAAKGAIPEETKFIQRGTLNIYVENRIPLDLMFRGYLLKINPLTPGKNDTIMKLPVDGLPRQIRGAAVNSSGFATTATPSAFSFSLTGAQVQNLRIADSLYIQFDVSTSKFTNSTIPVKLRDSDFIRTKLSGSLIYRVNEK